MSNTPKSVLWQAPAEHAAHHDPARLGLSLKRELLDHCGLFKSIDAAQAAIDAWVDEYNRRRPQRRPVADPATAAR